MVVYKGFHGNLQQHTRTQEKQETKVIIEPSTTIVTVTEVGPFQSREAGALIMTMEIF